MGFHIEPTVYRLRFEDPRLAGLEVTAHSVSIAGFMRITGMTAASVITGVTLKADAMPRDQLIEAVAGFITGWNLEDAKGKPIGHDYDGVAGQEPFVVRAIVKAWMEAVSGIDPNSVSGSGSPVSSPESSLPMDPSSGSPLS